MSQEDERARRRWFLTGVDQRSWQRASSYGAVIGPTGRLALVCIVNMLSCYWNFCRGYLTLLAHFY
eukprot:5332-Rhodomonas_salina.1